MRKFVFALTLGFAVVGGMLGTASGQTTPPLQDNASASATDTQQVANIEFYPGNRIVVTAGEDFGLKLQSGLSDVIDDDSMSVDYVFGSDQGKITAAISGGEDDTSTLSTSALLGKFGASEDGDGSNGMQLFLCDGEDTEYNDDCSALVNDTFSTLETVDVIYTSAFSGDGALLGDAPLNNVAQEGGNAASLKLAAKSLGDGPSEAFDDLTIDLVFTIQDVQ